MKKWMIFFEKIIIFLFNFVIKHCLVMSVYFLAIAFLVPLHGAKGYEEIEERLLPKCRALLSCGYIGYEALRWLGYGKPYTICELFQAIDCDEVLKGRLKKDLECALKSAQKEEKSELRKRFKDLLTNGATNKWGIVENALNIIPYESAKCAGINPTDINSKLIDKIDSEGGIDYDTAVKCLGRAVRLINYALELHDQFEEKESEL